MSDYVKATDFASKDLLPSGDPLKKVKGAEINDEFVAIQAAIASKVDKNSPVFTGIPTAPSPSIGSDTTQIATTEWVRDIINAIEPIGTIKAFAGTVGTIPSGWAVCDGTNNTLNLRDRFIAGFAPGGVFGQNGTDGHTPGANNTPVVGTTSFVSNHSHGFVTGGTALTVNQLPSHAHTLTSKNESNSTGSVNATTGTGGGNTTVVTDAVGGNESHNHAIFGDGGHQHNITGIATVPGFFALMFIQKISDL